MSQYNLLFMIRFAEVHLIIVGEKLMKEKSKIEQKNLKCKYVKY